MNKRPSKLQTQQTDLEDHAWQTLAETTRAVMDGLQLENFVSLKIDERKNFSSSDRRGDAQKTLNAAHNRK